MGTVYTWGKGDNGQLGHTVVSGDNEEESVKTELQLSIENLSRPMRMELASDIGEKLRFEGEWLDDADPSMMLAAGLSKCRLDNTMERRG